MLWNISVYELNKDVSHTVDMINDSAQTLLVLLNEVLDLLVFVGSNIK